MELSPVVGAIHACRISQSDGERMEPSIDIFDAAHYANVRKPMDEASHLPHWCYTSPAFYQREVEAVFRRSWVLIGRMESIANSGDYFTTELAGVPLIVLRDRNETVRAFANTCRHRGAKLLEGDGRCGSHIVCPYHSWSFALDGRLVAAPGMQGIKSFDLGLHGLVSARLDSWGGFLFVNLDGDAGPLPIYLGEITDILEGYDFGNMVLTRSKAFQLASNWKLIIENGMEDYHTATVHRGSIGAQKIEIVSGEGNWEAGFFESEKTIATLPGETMALPFIATLSERAKRGTHFVLLYPNVVLACNQDGVFWIELYPRAAGHTELILRFAFPRTTVALPNFEEIVQRYYRRCDISIPEDNRIAEIQQQGLNSPLARPGRVSPHEPIVHALANWLLDRVLRDAPIPVQKPHAA